MSNIWYRLISFCVPLKTELIEVEIMDAGEVYLVAKPKGSKPNYLF